MKILIVTQYYYPENFKSNDLSFELAKRGHNVTVLTGLPNYPEGKIFDGYGFFKKLNQNVNGVIINRSWLLPRGKGGGIRLFINYYSFAFFASLKALVGSFKNRYDAIIVHEPSPITQFYPALLLHKIQKTPVYFWVMDLWPESLEIAGRIKNKFVLNYFKNLVVKFYNNSKKILITSRGFEKSILEKGNFSNKIEYFPNWAEDTIAEGNLEFPIPQLPNGFIVMFAGNLGEAQDLESIMDAALQLRNNKRIQFVFVGDGRKMPFLKEFISINNLQDTVTLTGRFPVEAMSAFFNKAHVMLVSLKDDEIFNLTVPAKMQAYMSASKPIIAMLNGEGAELVRDSNCGVTVPAGDSSALAKSLTDLSKMTSQQIELMGKNSRKHFEKNFMMSSCMDNLERILNE